MTGNQYNTRAAARVQNVSAPAQENSTLSSSQVPIPEALRGNLDFQRYCAALFGHQGQPNDALAQRKCLHCINSRGELVRRLEKLEKGQTKLVKTIEEVKSELSEAVRNIDGRLRALEPCVENIPHFPSTTVPCNPLNYPVPPGYHLSPNRRSHPDGNYRVMKYPLPDGYQISR